MSGPDLVAAFLDELPGEARVTLGAAGEELAAALAEVIRTGALAWPDLPVPAESLVRQLAAGLPAGVADLQEAIRATQAADLHLACACAAGQDKAIVALEHATFGEIDAVVRRMRAPAAVADEARQVVRQEVLAPREGRPPAIARYAGRGDLRAWIRVTAVRHVLRVLAADRGHVEFEDDALYDVLAPVDEPELQHFKRIYKAEFVSAFRDAIEALTPKERTLLRYQAIDGLSIDEIGALYDVHRATVARWIAKARDTLLSRTRKALMKRLGVGRAECDSIMMLVQSRLDLSLERFLAPSRVR